MSSSSKDMAFKPSGFGPAAASAATPGATPSAAHGPRATASYQRFIPREELGDFATWRPGELGTPADTGTPQSGVYRAPPPASAATANPKATENKKEPTAADWLAQIAAARQAGYQDGYRDGLVALEGFKQSFSQQATAQIGALLDAFDTQTQALDAEVARAVAHTALQLARQVLRAELQTRPELVASVATEAIHSVMHSARHVAVHVHPQDLPLVAMGAEESLSARGARLQPDANVPRGGVLVHSDVGTVDARIATRWAQATATVAAGASHAVPWAEAADVPEASDVPSSAHPAGIDAAAGT
jgi:flagellar assembly protein FliH